MNSQIIEAIADEDLDPGEESRLEQRPRIASRSQAKFDCRKKCQNGKNVSAGEGRTISTTRRTRGGNLPGTIGTAETG